MGRAKESAQIFVLISLRFDFTLHIADGQDGKEIKGSGTFRIGPVGVGCRMVQCVQLDSPAPAVPEPIRRLNGPSQALIPDPNRLLPLVHGPFNIKVAGRC